MFDVPSTKNASLNQLIHIAAIPFLQSLMEIGVKVITITILSPQGHEAQREQAGC